MNWITSYLAVGDFDDLRRTENLRKNVDAVIDIRDAFYITGDNVWTIDAGLAFGYVTMIDSMTSKKKKVMIHCQGGIDRSPFIAALYLVHRKENPMNEEDAYELVKQKRPQTFKHLEWFSQIRDAMEEVNTDVEIEVDTDVEIDTEL